MRMVIVAASLIIAAAGGFFLAKLPTSSNPTLAITLFLIIACLALASFWIPKLEIPAFAIATIVLFYGWISSGNNLFLIGAIGLSIPVIVSVIGLAK